MLSFCAADPGADSLTGTAAQKDNMVTIVNPNRNHENQLRRKGVRFKDQLT